jgi:cyclase
MKGIALVLSLTSVVSSSCTGAAPEPPEHPLAQVEIETVAVAPGVHMLAGAGGNIAVSAGKDGILIVDDQYAPLTGKIRAAIAAIQAGPIAFVVNTHWHGDHTGGNENLGRAGSVIVAHENVRRRMASEQLNPFFGFEHEAGPQPRVTPASPEGALPVVTFTQDVTFHWNGDQIGVLHVERAHTDGDSVIRWKRADVFHMGDVFFAGGFPFIDVEAGGSVDGVIAAADRVIALASDTSRIIPGHGPLSTRADLVRYRDMLRTIRDRVAAGIAAGEALEQVVARRPTREWDAAFGSGFVDGEQLTRFVYASLVRQSRRARP